MPNLTRYKRKQSNFTGNKYVKALQPGVLFYFLLFNFYFLLYINNMNSHYIIFADDDADDLELITGFFKQYNDKVNVLEFMDGREVMEFLDRYAPAYGLPLLIVLDINMPRYNGKETLLSIRKHDQCKNIPVVIYSTSNNLSDEEFCRDNGASWVTKSSNLEGVRQIAKVLADFCELQKH